VEELERHLERCHIRASACGVSTSDSTRPERRHEAFHQGPQGSRARHRQAPRSATLHGDPIAGGRCTSEVCEWSPRSNAAPLDLYAHFVAERTMTPPRRPAPSSSGNRLKVTGRDLVCECHRHDPSLPRDRPARCRCEDEPPDRFTFELNPELDLGSGQTAIVHNHTEPPRTTSLVLSEPSVTGDGHLKPSIPKH